MRNTVIGVLITITVICTILLADRSMRINRHLPENSTETGNILPVDVKFQTFASKETLTLDKFKGKVILLNFWATWCEACMAEMPSIQKLYVTLKDRGLEVVAVNVDDRPERAVPLVIDKLHLTFPVYTDSDGELNRHFEVAALPYSVVVSRNQKIVWSEAGERDWASEKVISEIRKLLDEKI